MKIFGVLGFLILITHSAMADQYVRFDRISKAKQALWVGQASATVPVHFKSGLNCTAVFVGPHGEALTNLHCVEDCLNQQGVTDAVSVPELNLQKMQINNAKLPVTCSVEFEKLIPPQAKDVEILHVFGPGWLTPRENVNVLMNASPPDYLNLVNQGFESFGDLVLIRLPVADNPCVSITGEDFTGADPVDLVSLSYPIVFRKVDDNPMGETLFVLGTTLMWSAGPASANPLTLADVLNDSLKPNVDLITPPGLLISSTDAEGGASGSPLFNKDGKLVAITRSTWKGFSSDYEAWTSGAINLSLHKAWIQANVSDAQKCQ